MNIAQIARSEDCRHWRAFQRRTRRERYVRIVANAAFLIATGLVLANGVWEAMSRIGDGRLW